MQKERSNKVFLGNTASLCDDARRSSAIDVTASNYYDAKEKVKKNKGIDQYWKDGDIAKYIPGLLELNFEGMLELIDTRSKVEHSSYADMEQLNFQILLTDNYFINPNSILICFPIKVKKKNNQALDLDANLITANNFFAHFDKKISVTKYGSDKEIILKSSPNEIYQYSDPMLKHLLKDALKTIEKTLLYSKEAVCHKDVNIGKRNHNGGGLTITGMNATQIATLKKTMLRT